eukprot:jgi/Psemu1/7343/gm1.7343_g
MNCTTVIPQSQTKALGSIPVHWSSREVRRPTEHSTSSCGTAWLWEDHKETPVSELPGCMDDEGGTIEGRGNMIKETINMNGAKQGYHIRLKTSHNSAVDEDKGMTELSSSVKNSIKGNNHTQAGMEGNSHTQTSINKDEEDSDVSDDSSIDVKNPYPTCHNFSTAVREENKRNKAIDKLIARVNWNALQLKIGSRCMHICHHQTNIENLQMTRRAILHSVKMLAEMLGSLPFPVLLEG